MINKTNTRPYIIFMATVQMLINYLFIFLAELLTTNHKRRDHLKKMETNTFQKRAQFEFPEIQ